MKRVNITRSAKLEKNNDDWTGPILATVAIIGILLMVAFA